MVSRYLEGTHRGVLDHPKIYTLGQSNDIHTRPHQACQRQDLIRHGRDKASSDTSDMAETRPHQTWNSMSDEVLSLPCLMCLRRPCLLRPHQTWQRQDLIRHGRDKASSDMEETRPHQTWQRQDLIRHGRDKTSSDMEETRPPQTWQRQGLIRHGRDKASSDMAETRPHQTWQRQDLIRHGRDKASSDMAETRPHQTWKRQGLIRHGRDKTS